MVVCVCCQLVSCLQSVQSVVWSVDCPPVYTQQLVRGVCVCVCVCVCVRACVCVCVHVGNKDLIRKPILKCTSIQVTDVSTIECNMCKGKTPYLHVHVRY